MRLNKSTGWKVLAVAIAITGICLGDATIVQSQGAWTPVPHGPKVLPPPDPARTFEGTAYCKGTLTAAGVAPTAGVAAADPTVLPLGSVVAIKAPRSRYSGIYTILDTGPEVQGRHVDLYMLYMWSCRDALAFGRRRLTIRVLRFGWNPQDSAMVRMVHGREARFSVNGDRP